LSSISSKHFSGGNICESIEANGWMMEDGGDDVKEE
jgi:hypothetical protein